MAISRFVLLACLFLVTLTGCVDKKSQARGVYMLVDTSGTYTKQLKNARNVVNYLLGTLNPGDSFAVARVKSRSFTEKDIIAKVTFDKVPSRMNAQKTQFKDKFDAFTKTMKKGSAHTDITGGIIQGAEYLNEAGAGRKMIVIFSDMQEELDKKTIRNFPIKLTNIKFVALKVTKLRSDNIDPRLYLGRLENWKKRLLKAGASEFKVVNDMEQLQRIFAK